jgi:hypothetical protein
VPPAKNQSSNTPRDEKHDTVSEDGEKRPDLKRGNRRQAGRMQRITGWLMGEQIEIRGEGISAEDHNPSSESEKEGVTSGTRDYQAVFHSSNETQDQRPLARAREAAG